jgi:putative redox protein
MMKVDCDWNGKSKFVANINGFRVLMDATKPFGEESAPTPKELLLASLCGCTGMDVAGLLKKARQPLEKMRIEAESESATEHPRILQNIKLVYFFEGPCDPDKVSEAVSLSQTKFCSVSAMISRGTKISYEIILNGKSIGKAEADFQKDANWSDVSAVSNALLPGFS